MPIYDFNPSIVIRATNRIEARNALLRLLAKAELDGIIERFMV